MRVALIPAYNEEKTIAKVIEGCVKRVDRIFVCDDGSTDGSSGIIEIASRLYEKVLTFRHSKNMGKGEALRDLFKQAIEYESTEVITLDADGQHDPADIPKLLEALKDADMVIGGRTGIPLIRGIGNLMLAGFGKFDTQSGFRAYRGSVLSKLIPSEMGMAVDSEIFDKAQKQGLKIVQVEVSANYDVPHPSKYNMGYHFLDVAFTTFKLATFRHPLLLYGIPGLAFILVSIVFGIRAYDQSLYGIGGFPVAITLGLFSIYLMLIGLVSSSLAILLWTVVTMERRLEK